MSFCANAKNLNKVIKKPYGFRNKEKLYNSLVKISETQKDFRVYESCANFVFVKTPAGKELWEYLKANSIVIRYMGDYIRITAGTEQEVIETVKCINEFFMR